MDKGLDSNSIATYLRIIENIHQSSSILNYFNGNYNSTLIRHDVDRKPKNSLSIAEVENSCDVKSSYYFRDLTFSNSICDKICNLGHEIGYHYETLSQENGNFEKAIERFALNLDRFRENFEIKTICMHGSPLSKYDNRLLWERYDYYDYGIVGDASMDVDDSYIYITDTGGSWNSKQNLRDNINDRVGSLENTQDLISLLKSGDKIYLNTHPERWSSNPVEQFTNSLKDRTFNFGKSIIKTIRK